MFSADVQRALIAHLRTETPLAYADATADLRESFARRMKAAVSREERRIIASQYRQVRSAMVTQLARLVAKPR